MKESLDFLYKEQKELSLFGGIGALLGWDQMTYMPADGSEDRADQIALLSRLSHERIISDTLYSHLQTVIQSPQFDTLPTKDKLVMTRLKTDVDKARKIPPAFVEEVAQTTTRAYTAWTKAKEQKRYALFAPHLEKIINLELRYCDYKKLPGHPYNNLLDDFEEGMTVTTIQEEFAYLKPRLTELLTAITTSKHYTTQPQKIAPFNVDHQKVLCHILFNTLGLREETARLDVSVHPFTITIGDKDVRITTNYTHQEPLFSFLSTVHEAGHALYELGLPQDEYKDTVISDAPSLGLHESQSRFWENMIAKGSSFWTYFYPIFQKTLRQPLQKIPFDTWYRSINHVQPSCIRIEADELTYCLHIILRFELELLLLEEKLTIKELPDCWNEKTQQLLGVTPSNDAEGVLQDMHWSTGDFGYFPTYALGTIYATQLYKQLLREKPEILSEITHGVFTTVLQWLRDHVHRYGRMMSADDIIKNTCGEGLNAQVYLGYLKEKYSSLYDL